MADWPVLYGRLLAGDLDVVVAETSHAVGDGRLTIEPLPADHPYWSHPRVTVLPHIAAPTSSDRSSSG